MKDDFSHISPETKDGLCNVIVETPRGSNSKFKYEPELRLFVLHRAMPKGTVFPYDYGFIPGTMGGDGDALDIMVLNDTDSFPGCLVQTRLIGAIAGRQKDEGKSENQNDCLIAIASTSIEWQKVCELRELPARMIDQVEEFFVYYRRLQQKIFKPQARKSAAQARKILLEAAKRAAKA